MFYRCNLMKFHIYHKIHHINMRNMEYGIWNIHGPNYKNKNIN